MPTFGAARSKLAGMIRPVINTARVTYWKRYHKNFLVVFTWHQVTPKFDPYRHHKYTWTQFDKFAQQIEYLAREFTIIPLHEAILHLKRGSLPGACAALSFDDGDISISENVVPFLKQRGLPATVFINTAYLGGHRSYWFPILSYLRFVEHAEGRSMLTDDLSEKAQALRSTTNPRLYEECRCRIEELASLVPNLDSRLVSIDWLSKLDGDQFTIGAHGHEHQRFSMMPSEWQRGDLRKNVQALMCFRGYRPIFAIPFGRSLDYTAQSVSIAHEKGLEVVLSNGGINLAAGSVYHRIPSDDKTPSQIFFWR
jgi:peptidoglycan/xylan/chitin deacetylase (PgdA/CDA1 family)